MGYALGGAKENQAMSLGFSVLFDLLGRPIPNRDWCGHGHLPRPEIDHVFDNPLVNLGYILLGFSVLFGVGKVMQGAHGVQ